MVRGTALFVGLFNNLAIFIVLVAIYGYLDYKLENKNKKLRSLVMSLLFGSTVLACMNSKIPVYEGVIVDQRNTIVILSTFFGGPLCGIITAIIAILYRTYLGGIGVLGGISGITLSFIAGIFLYKLKQNINRWWKGIVLAIASTIFVLPGFLVVDNIRAGWELMKSMTLPYGSAMIIGLLFTGFLLDREERNNKKTKELKLSEEKYRLLFENLIDVYFRVDINDSIKEISPSCKKVLGYDTAELFNSSFIILVIDIKEYEKLREMIYRNERVDNFEIQLLTKGKNKIWGSISGRTIKKNNKNIGFEGMIRDVTLLKKRLEEQRHIEENLQQIQKMESIGTLAGGIAHDFNNILAAIIGHTEIAMQEVSERDPVKDELNGILKSAIRAKELIRQILVFSRKVTHEPIPLEIIPVIKETLQLLRASIPSNIEIKSSFLCQGIKIVADPIEIHQIIINICTNAAQAMEETGGIISVTVERVFRESKEENEILSKKPYVFIRISDTGPGIDEEIIDRIFEPFFTTKEVGKGTGMGLAVVQGIITRLKGDIEVKSKKGEGATFNIYLPEITEENKKEREENTQALKGGNERILFIDDEPQIVDVTTRRLQKLGYKVTSFTHSEAALEAFRKDPFAFDCIITDQAMPKMTGLQLTEAIMQIRKEIPVIMISGFGISKDIGRPKGVKAVIIKPFDFETLAKTIREVLDKREK